MLGVLCTCSVCSRCVVHKANLVRGVYVCKYVLLSVETCGLALQARNECCLGHCHSSLWAGFYRCHA